MNNNLTTTVMYCIFGKTMYLHSFIFSFLRSYTCYVFLIVFKDYRKDAGSVPHSEKALDRIVAGLCVLSLCFLPWLLWILCEQVSSFSPKTVYLIYIRLDSKLVVSSNMRVSGYLPGCEVG